MISTWQNPLPSCKYTDPKVIVYFYNGRWVPITFFSLQAAIQLCRQAQQDGYELFIFPAHLAPDAFEPSALLAVNPTHSITVLEPHRSCKQVG